MRITREGLRQKLQALDERLLQIWIDNEIELNDDERWEIFIVLLETRVNLLIACRDAGVHLSGEDCMPPWLEKLTSNRKETRLRDLKVLYDEVRTRKTIKTFEDVARLGEESDF